MTHQMQKIRDKHRILLEYNDVLPEAVKVVLLDALQEACVEYARSIVPSREPSNIYNTGSSADMSRLGFNACVAECFLAIQQDSLDLPTN